jgi:4-hydroxymandelate oxidase
MSAAAARYTDVAAVEAQARTMLSSTLWETVFEGSPPYPGNLQNLCALRDVKLRPRVLTGAGERDLQASALGTPIAMPAIVAPVGLQRRWHPAGELATANAAGRLGTIFVLSTVSSETIEDVAEAASGPLWFQLYFFRNRDWTRSLIERAEAAGYRAIVVTVDTVTYDASGERDMFPGDPTADDVLANFRAYGDERDALPTARTLESHFENALGWRDIDWIRSVTSVPIVVKGIQTAEDAALCVEHGVEGIVVSNHGGHAVGGGYGTAEILPRVADKVAGETELYLDGGIRSGTDVLKALALGARAVLLGRAAMWGLTVAGEQGVAGVLEIIRNELLNVTGLCGVPDLTAVSRDLVDAPVLITEPYDYRAHERE